MWTTTFATTLSLGGIHQIRSQIKKKQEIIKYTDVNRSSSQGKKIYTSFSSTIIVKPKYFGDINDTSLCIITDHHFDIENETFLEMSFNHSFEIRRSQESSLAKNDQEW